MSSLNQALKLALSHHQEGRLDQAESLYQHILEKVPKHSPTLHLMGQLTHQRGDHEQALELIGRAISVDEQVAIYYNSRGAAERSLGRFDEAAESFSKALSLKPSYEEAWFNQVKLLNSRDDTRAMATSLDAWVAHCPDSIEARKERAAHRYGQGDIEGSIQEQDQVARIDPTDVESRLRQGILALELGRPEDSLRALQDAQNRFQRASSRTKSTVQTKLEHDRQQIKWLISEGLVPDSWAEIAHAYGRARDVLYPPGQPTETRARPLDSEVESLIGQWYNQPIHRMDCPALSGGALSASWNGADIEAHYRATEPGITWIDGLLGAEALTQLHRFCLGSTIWTDFQFSGNYVGSALREGFANGLLLQIASEMRTRLPGLLGRHPLRQMWAFKYDQRHTGIRAHADSAAVNINFWITPDSANLDPNSGGLVVWRKTAPMDWDFNAFNRDPDRLLNWASQTGAERIEVPYRCNRAVIFDSNLVHRTADHDFAPGYENRRINITMLFGRRSQARG